MHKRLNVNLFRLQASDLATLSSVIPAEMISPASSFGASSFKLFFFWP